VFCKENYSAFPTSFSYTSILAPIPQWVNNNLFFKCKKIKNIKNLLSILSLVAKPDLKALGLAAEPKVVGSAGQQDSTLIGLAGAK